MRYMGKGRSSVNDSLSAALRALGRVALLGAGVGVAYMVGSAAFALAEIPGAEPLAWLFGVASMATLGFVALGFAHLVVKGVGR